MDVVTIHTANTKLSQLLLRVEAGEEVVLARGKHLGAMRGVLSVAPDFDAPLPEAELAAWE